MESEYESIATKVVPYVKRRINRICEKRGMKAYRMLQMMCDCVVRYMDDRHNLTPEMEKVMSIFEHMDGWKDCFNLADPTVKKEVTEAIYVLTDPTGKRKGQRCILVRKPFMGVWDQTENVQQILERAIELLSPERYRRLRHLAIDMECNSILELLDTLIDAHTIEQLNADMRRDFEDCNRHDYGKPIEYGQRTKQKKHRTPDAMTGLIQFSKTDDAEDKADY